MGKSGLDTGKLGPASIFYLPCQPQDKTGKYFKVFKDKNRKPLDVYEWIDKITVKDVPSYDWENQDWVKYPSTASGQKNQRKINTALEKWRVSYLSPGTGHDEFFQLAKALATSGCDPYEVRYTLTVEANNGRSPSERLGEIEHLINSLTKMGMFHRSYAPLSSNTA
jgi:hypothetical protein